MTGSLFEEVERIADAVMYEGYVLYPYRASAIKNRLRWQFGVVAPREYSERSGTDAWHLQTESVLEPVGAARLTVRVRWLHLQRRTVERATGVDEWTGCDRLVVDGREMRAWDEAVPQAVTVADVAVDELCVRELVRDIDVAGALAREVVHGSQGQPAARITRERWPAAAVVRVAAEPAGGFVKVRLRVENVTMAESRIADRESALCRSLLGCHILLHVQDGAFVSSIDPPPAALAVVASCVNQGTWPVLAGAPGTRHLMLSAPIILYDYPAIAPESDGDFFDGTEIDELLALRVMTMTDQEKREAVATDERARQIVARTGDQPTAELAKLHGAIRSFEDILNPPEAPPPDRAVVQIGPTTVACGSRVRLAPKKRADAIDMFLSGRLATVAAVHRDLEDRIYVAVTLDDDPGADLRRAFGRFFYFAPDEIMPVAPEAARETLASPRVLVAGLGNIFLGDDAFGVEVARRLLTAGLPPDVRVVDAGIRSVHLGYELREAQYETTILVDVVRKGGDPGTLYVLEPDEDPAAPAAADAHSLGPGDVLALVRRLGGRVGRVWIVGCEPLRLDQEPGLSPIVAAAVDEAVPLIQRLVASALNGAPAHAGS